MGVLEFISQIFNSPLESPVDISVESLDISIDVIGVPVLAEKVTSVSFRNVTTWLLIVA